MAEIIARFADGRLLVQEDKALEEGTINTSGQARFRIGDLKTVEKVLSIDASISGYPNLKVATELRDVLVSGDTLLIQLRRADFGYISSGMFSGAVSGLLPADFGIAAEALSYLSGLTSGIGYHEPIVSTALVSGKLLVLANVIGF